MPSAGEVVLRTAHFAEISRIVTDIAGIQLPPGKEGLVQSRLARRLRQLGVPSFDAYLERVRDDATGRERAEMIDLLTTNKTSFFREPAHFDMLRDTVVPTFAAAPNGLRLWSAGCSTGEEPYTIAMVLREAASSAGVDGPEPRVLATDLSHRVLEQAARGVYSDAQLAEVPGPLRGRYFVAESGDRWRVAPALRGLVRFAGLNLLGAWPMRGPFHAIFCRNVMIYFDKPTQQALVARFHALLATGGYLFVGHSESLTALDHDFAYVRPAVYRK
ncbi:MAG TPA: protein-glutamate O-methyltransferase CheR [Gemmatirosa sp.]